MALPIHLSPTRGLCPGQRRYGLSLTAALNGEAPQGQLWAWQQSPGALLCGAGRRAMQGPGLLQAGTACRAPAAEHPHALRVGTARTAGRGQVSPSCPDTAEPLGENLAAQAGVCFAKKI